MEDLTNSPHCCVPSITKNESAPENEDLPSFATIQARIVYKGLKKTRYEVDKKDLIENLKVLFPNTSEARIKEQIGRMISMGLITDHTMEGTIFIEKVDK